MERTHEVSLYRRGSSSGRTASGRPQKAWGGPLATGLPGNFQPSGGMKAESAGKKVEIDALYFVHPSSYPSGVVPSPNDGVVVTSGPTVRSTFRVHDVVRNGGGPFDDELLLIHSEESIP